MAESQSRREAVAAFGDAPRPWYERMFKRGPAVDRPPKAVAWALGAVSVLCASAVSAGAHPLLVRWVVLGLVAIGPPWALDRWWRDRARRRDEALMPELSSGDVRATVARLAAVSKSSGVER